MRLQRGYRRCQARSESGGAIAEFALIGFIVFFLIGVVVQGAFIFSAWLIITNATREGARFGSPCYDRGPDAQECTLEQIQSYTTQIAGPLDPTMLTVPEPTEVVVTDASGNKSRFLKVTATYHVPLLAPFVELVLSSDGIVVSAESVMRVENGGG